MAKGGRVNLRGGGCAKRGIKKKRLREEIHNGKNFVQKAKQLLKENLKCILLHMLTCMHQEFAQVKLHQVVKKVVEKSC
jgi:hypothetical protein